MRCGVLLKKLFGRKYRGVRHIVCWYTQGRKFSLFHTWAGVLTNEGAEVCLRKSKSMILEGTC
jgi:hypothetical protein